jgi:hypothetical protein
MRKTKRSMRTLSPSELQGWLDDPTTIEVRRRVVTRISEAQEILSESPGRDPITDSMIGGMIRAFREVLDIEADEESV